MALDYASIMAAGQSLVPDLRQQMMQDQQTRMMQDMRKQQLQNSQFAAMEKQHAFERQGQFEAALTEAVHTKDPLAISRLMVQFPEFANQVKPGWEALSTETQKRNLTQVGTAYTRAMTGDYEGAATVLSERIAADKAAGMDTADDERVIAALRSGDEKQQKTAIGTMGIMLASQNPDKFAETYGKVFATDKLSPFAKEYNDRVQLFGKAEADKWAAMQDEKFIPVQQGGSVYRGSDLITGGGPAAQAPGAAPLAQGGGGQAASVSGASIEERAKQTVPGLIVTSRQRSAAHNAAVGGVTDSYHLTGQARDFVPPAGMSMAQLHARLKSAFPGFDVLNEGDHVHIEPGPGMGHSSGKKYTQAKTVNGTTYYQIGGKWFDNPEGR